MWVLWVKVRLFESVLLSVYRMIKTDADASLKLVEGGEEHLLAITTEVITDNNVQLMN